MSKPIDTIRARCALAGITLHVTEDDLGKPLFIASRWAMTRSFSSAEEVEAWLARVTGQSNGAHA